MPGRPIRILTKANRNFKEGELPMLSNLSEPLVDASGPQPMFCYFVKLTIVVEKESKLKNAAASLSTHT